MLRRLTFKCNIEQQQQNRVFIVNAPTALKVGIVYPLAVKSTQVLDLAHQKERVALWCSWIQSPHFKGAYMHKNCSQE